VAVWRAISSPDPTGSGGERILGLGARQGGKIFSPLQAVVELLRPLLVAVSESAAPALSNMWRR